MPARFAQYYLWFTFGLFFLGGFVGRADNLLLLITFVSIAYAALYAGYWFGAGTSARRAHARRLPTAQIRRISVTLIVCGSLYFAVWAVNQIREFGAGSVADVFSNIVEPGSAYAGKFEVYKEREEAGYINPVTQVLVLFSVLQAALIPLLVVWWSEISRPLRAAALMAIALYIISFLYIGTQKGVGDVVIYSLAGFAVRAAHGGKSMSRGTRAKVVALIVLGLIASFAYMAINQSSRAIEFGITEVLMFGDVGGSLLARTVGEPMAVGIYTILAYPSHGYLGLAYNLSQEFVFSFGAGISQAFESYRYQYLGGAEHHLLTYPVRTEAATGWPAGMYWATAFPWLASDVTFPGTVVLLFLVGFLMARVWIRAVVGRDWLSIIAFGQFLLFIAFLPANNQVLMQRPGLWTVGTLVGLSVVRALSQRVR